MVHESVIIPGDLNSVYVCACLCVCVCVCVRERERQTDRERDRDRKTGECSYYPANLNINQKEV